jgi:SulP family sulfate permease
VIAGSLTRKPVNSDKELIGQGIGNLASGLFGGLPGAGATMGTVVNIQAGGRSALSGLTRAAILAVVVIWAGSLTANIPLAVLAGIAVKVGIDIIDWRFISRAHRVSIKGALIMYGVIAVTVFVDLITAVGIGLFIANVLTIRRLAELQVESVFILPARRKRDDNQCAQLTSEERSLLAQGRGRLKLLYLSGPLVFGAAVAINRQAIKFEGAKAVVVDLSQVPHMGVTTAVAMESAVRDALTAGIKVFMAGAHGQPRERLEHLGLREVMRKQCWVEDRTEALRLALAEIQPTGQAAAAPDSTHGAVA